MDKDDAKLLVRFFTDRQKNEFKSAEEGRDIFDEVECISIRVPGSRDEVVHLVSDEHRMRFAPIYKQWKSDAAAPISGTPLDQWPAASTNFIDEMRMYGVRTVEQLADLSDGVAMNNVGWVTMRTKAAAWLEQAKDDGVTQRLAVENETLKKRLDEMQEQMAQILSAQSGKRGRGARSVTVSDDDIAEVSQSLTAA